MSQGNEHAHGTGYSGSGLKFNEDEEKTKKDTKKSQTREYGFEEYYKSNPKYEDYGICKVGGDLEHSIALVQVVVLVRETWIEGTTNVSSLPGKTLPISDILVKPLPIYGLVGVLFQMM